MLFLNSDIIKTNALSLKLIPFLFLVLSPLFAMAEPTGTPNVLRVSIAKAAMETGLIQALAKNFESQNPGVSIKFESTGAIQALDHARDGLADMTITHHPPEERRLVSQGVGLHRSNIMYNEYALFGPPSELAGLSESKDIVNVLRHLAEKEAPFLEPSPRGGTYRKIRELWVSAGVNPQWFGYENTGTSALEALRQAAELEAFAMAEVGVYRRHRQELGPDIAILFRDDLTLRNVYSAVVVNAEFVAGVNQTLAQAFEDYLVSPEGQSFIQQFNKENFGVAVLSPAAHLDKGLLQRRAEKALKQEHANLRVLSILSAGLGILLLTTIVLFVRARSADRRHLEMEHRSKTDSQKRELAENANRIKSEFLAVMSHEMRTPLTAIIGYSEMMVDELEDEEHKINTRIISRSGKHLLQLIGDILDLSKVEAEKLDVERIAVNVPNLLSELKSFVDINADEKGLGFDIACQFPIPKIIQSDLLRLKQVLLNLCNNAVKFTDEGQVSVTVSFDPEVREISFDIVDSGIGVKKESLKRIFEPFTQADSSATRKYGGTGLGLSLSKSLAEKLGGRITVESTEGEGSCFTLVVDTGVVADGDIVRHPEDWAA